MGQAAFVPLKYISLPYASTSGCSGESSICLAWASLDIVVPTVEQIRKFTPEERQERFIFWSSMFSYTLLGTLGLVEAMRQLANKLVDRSPTIANRGEYRPLLEVTPRGVPTPDGIAVNDEQGDTNLGGPDADGDAEEETPMPAPQPVQASYQVEDVFFVAYMMLYISSCFAIVEYSILEHYLSLDVGLDYEYYFLLFLEAMVSHICCAFARCVRHVNRAKVEAKAEEEQRAKAKEELLLPPLATKVPTTILPVSSEKVEMLRDIVTISIYLQEGYNGCAVTATLGILIPNIPIFMDPALTANIRDAYWPILSVHATEKKKANATSPNGRCSNLLRTMLVEMDGLTQEHRLYLALLEDGLQLVAGTAFTLSMGIANSSKFVLVSALLSAAKLTFVYFARKPILCLMARNGIPWVRLTVRDIGMIEPCWAANWQQIVDNMFTYLNAGTATGMVRASALSHLAALDKTHGVTEESTDLTRTHSETLKARSGKIFKMLIEALEDESIEEQVVDMLRNKLPSEEAVDEYRRVARSTHVLRKHNEGVNENMVGALKTLGELGEQAEVAYGPLHTCLKDPNPDVRQGATEAMLKMPWHSMPSRRCLAVTKDLCILAVDDRYRGVRGGAIAVLGRLHASDAKDAKKEALETLFCLTLLFDDVEESRQDKEWILTRAIKALLEHEEHVVRPKLLKALTSDEIEIGQKPVQIAKIANPRKCRCNAALALGEGAEEAFNENTHAEVVKALLGVAERSEGQDDEVRASAIRALGKFRQRASPAMPFLLSILENQSKFIEGQSKSAVPSPTVKATLDALAQLGKIASDALTPLAKMINQESISYQEVGGYMSAFASIAPPGRGGLNKVLSKIREMTVDLAKNIRSGKHDSNHYYYSPECLEVLELDPTAVTLDDLRKPLQVYNAKAEAIAQGKGKGKGKQAKGEADQNFTETEMEAMSIEWIVAFGSVCATLFLGRDVAPLLPLLTEMLKISGGMPFIRPWGAFILVLARQVENPTPTIEALQQYLQDSFSSPDESPFWLSRTAVIALGEFGRWQQSEVRNQAISILQKFKDDVSGRDHDDKDKDKDKDKDDDDDISGRANDSDENMRYLISGSLRMLGHSGEAAMQTAEGLITELKSETSKEKRAAILYAMKGFQGTQAESCIENVKPIVKKGTGIIPEDSEWDADSIEFYSACRTLVDLTRGLEEHRAEAKDLLQVIANNQRRIDYRVPAKSALREFDR